LEQAVGPAVINEAAAVSHTFDAVVVTGVPVTVLVMYCVLTDSEM
jgi:hypothetical protein